MNQQQQQPPPYAPPQGPYYPPPAQPYPQTQMQQMQQSSSNTNVVVVNASQPAGQTVIVEKRGVNHCLHCIITLLFFPWIIVWIVLCITEGC